MDEKPTHEEMRFLTALIQVGGKTTRRGLPGASRAQDRARQHAKQMGWVRYAAVAKPTRVPGSNKQWMWCITASGRRVVEAANAA